MSEGRLDIFNEDGSLKSKEEFIEETSKLYDEITKTIQEDKCHCNKEDLSLFDLVSDPECQTDVRNALDNFEYYTRTIYLEGEISIAKATAVHRLITFYNKIDSTENVPVENRTPIKIYLNSEGGDLDAGFSIISSIKLSATPVYTYNIGRAWSCAFFILIAGDKRFGVPHSTYLFHEGSCGNMQDAHKYINHTNFYVRQLKDLRKIVLDNTQITEEEYDSHIKDDWWLDADEAYMYDIIDEIIDNILQEEFE